jgi:SagB-type dehydrogenase family enzyme
MTQNTFVKLLSGENDAEAWEAFHEASKTSKFDAPLAPETVRQRMTAMWPSFRYESYPATRLPLSGRLDMTLSDTVINRETARDICPARLSIEQVATLLFHTCGETRDETKAGFPRKFRVAPSGGAMYPLEIYIHSSQISSLRGGIYHYNPCDHTLRRIIDGDRTRELSAALVQGRLAREASMLAFITAVPERSTFKYGERGYRFALIEAGHLAQNFVLAATALGLGAVTIGGFLDRAVDELLCIDGLDHGTIYMLAVGGRSGQNWLS